MLVCEGRVTTLWAWALVNTRPWAARRSSTGVCDRLLPANPGASARRVSMVMRTMSRDGPEGIAGALPAGGGAAASRSPARAAIAADFHFDMTEAIVAGGPHHPDPLLPIPLALPHGEEGRPPPQP